MNYTQLFRKFLDQQQPAQKIIVHIFLVVGCLVMAWHVGSASAANDTSSVVSFTDVTASAGVGYLQHQYAPSSNSYPDFMSGGAAAGDFDGDGWVDLYVTRLDAPDILFRNQQDGTFADVTTTAFGAAPVNLRSNGAQWGDVDNDGDQDLYVTTLDESRFYLFINDGTGRFTEDAMNRGAAIETGRPTSGFSIAFGDYDLDGYLDIHTTEWSFDNPELSHARLLRNQGAAAPGSFVDATLSAGVTVDRASPEGIFAFASRFTDLDGDRRPDLVVAGDFGTSRLFWNNGDGTFTDGTADAGVGTDENGMGSTVGDFDGDGRLDWMVTSIYDSPNACDGAPCSWGITGNRLYRNLGDRTFEDATDAAGVRDGGWGWGATFLDFDNDGDLDIAQTNGVDFPNFAFGDQYENDATRLWENDGTGQFTEIASLAGITDTASGKGILTFDYDNDGDLDLFITNNAGQPILYRNDGGNDNNWLRVDVEGTLSNRDGIGALVKVTPDLNFPEEFMIWEIDGGSNFLAQNERAAFFGLGDFTSVDLVSISWPSGVNQTLTNVPTRETLFVVEPVPEPATLAMALLSVVVVCFWRKPGNQRGKVKLLMT